MIIIRDVFQCQPGQHMAVVSKFEDAIRLFEYGDKARILVDVAAGFWTVVVEYQAESLAGWEEFKSKIVATEELQTAIAGYRELVISGRREIYRVV